MLTIGQLSRLAQISPRMLRHYDQLGLLRPEHVDPKTGYRSYRVAQLARLQRLIALRDLGFGLDTIRGLLDEQISVERLRGMLQLRRSQIEESVAEDLDRMRRVEACLHALESSPPHANVVIKVAPAMRLAEAQATAPGFGHENLGPVFMKLIPEVAAHLKSARAKPGIMVAHYDEPADDGTVVLHAGFDIGEQLVKEAEDVRVVTLPSIEVASCVYRGSMIGIGAAYEALLRYIDDSGYVMSAYSRELYLEVHGPLSPDNVTELQVPIARR